MRMLLLTCAVVYCMLTVRTAYMMDEHCAPWCTCSCLPGVAMDAQHACTALSDAHHIHSGARLRAYAWLVSIPLHIAHAQYACTVLCDASCGYTGCTLRARKCIVCAYACTYALPESTAHAMHS
jgi:hypothetical protein